MMQRTLLVVAALVSSAFATPLAASVAADTACPSSAGVIPAGGTVSGVASPACFSLAVPDQVTAVAVNIQVSGSAPLAVYANKNSVTSFADPDDVLDPAQPGDNPYWIPAAFFVSPTIGVFSAAGPVSILSFAATAGTSPPPGCESTPSTRSPRPDDLIMAQVAPTPTPAPKIDFTVKPNVNLPIQQLLPINAQNTSKCAATVGIGADSPGAPSGSTIRLGSAPGAVVRVPFKTATRDTVRARVTWTAERPSTVRLVLDGPRSRDALAQTQASAPGGSTEGSAQIEYAPGAGDDAAGWWRLRVVNVSGGVIAAQTALSFTVQAPNQNTTRLSDVVNRVTPKLRESLVWTRPDVALPDVPRPTVIGANFCFADEAPKFVFGFADLSGRLGRTMGEPKECEHANPQNGDTLQQTTTGLSFYRKSTNTPTFTDGWDHWGLTRQGLVHWTGDSIDPPANP